ncbi:MULTISPECIES: Gfo/Idh/MocA family protein [unclassified Paenibacillus]|uniref:Gfo/Idh/MocA family protein n=1 Tax=unclassified Paenibacillus TaxID=185978 RepID=UPI003641C2C4
MNSTKFTKKVSEFMNRKINCAVIGLGKIGLLYDLESNREKPSSHTLAYHLNDNYNLVGAVDPLVEKELILEKFVPSAKFYPKVEQLFYDHAIDVVSVCTPPYNRYHLIQKILEYSSPKIIFCEKPIESSFVNAKKLISLINQTDTILIPNFSRRWNQGMQKVRECIIDNVYGRPIKIHIRYTRGIFNTGSHLFDLIRFMLGDIEEVRVLEKITTSAEEEGEYSFTFHFRVNSNIIGYAEAFNDQNYYMFEIDIYFEYGKVEIMNSGNEVNYYRTGDHPLFEGWKSLQKETTQSNLLKDSNLKNAMCHIADILLYNEKPVANESDGIYPLMVAEALMKSFINKGSLEKVEKS